jgi:hypothetical protein
VAATRNFDLAVFVKESASAGGDGKDSKDREREYVFMSIDRSEHANLNDYLLTKEIKIKNAQEVGPSAAYSGKARMDELLGNLDGAEGAEDSDDADEDSEDDGDYESGRSSHSGDSDNSDVSDESGDEGGGDEDKVRAFDR